MQLKPVAGLFPTAVYRYPRYLYANATIAAPETELVRLLVENAPGVVLVVGLELVRGVVVPEGVLGEGVAASAATGMAPKPVLATRPRARSGFLIRDLQGLWSH
jgi:hypothetical protein